MPGRNQRRVGLPGGTVVVSSEGLMADLRPYRLLNGGTGEYWFDGHFPATTYDAILAANEHTDFPHRLGQDCGRQRVLSRTVPTRWRGVYGNPGNQDGLAALDS